MCTFGRNVWTSVLVVASALVALAVSVPSALAVAPDECEKQRARFPSNWNDVSAETPIHLCRSHYAGVLQVRLGAPDAAGRRPMSLVPMRGGERKELTRDPERKIRRIWLDADQAKRLREGRYFATVVRAEESCWIRGDLSDDVVFFIDAADPPSDEDGVGAFYNKAPRIGVFEGNAYTCEPW